MGLRLRAALLMALMAAAAFTGAEAWRSLRAPEDMPRILESRDRALAGPTAPAAGLTLWEVLY